MADIARTGAGGVEARPTVSGPAIGTNLVGASAVVGTLVTTGMPPAEPT